MIGINPIERADTVKKPKAIYPDSDVDRQIDQLAAFLKKKRTAVIGDLVSEKIEQIGWEKFDAPCGAWFDGITEKVHVLLFDGECSVFLSPKVAFYIGIKLSGVNVRGDDVLREYIAVERQGEDEVERRGTAVTLRLGKYRRSMSATIARQIGNRILKSVPVEYWPETSRSRLLAASPDIKSTGPDGAEHA